MLAESLGTQGATGGIWDLCFEILTVCYNGSLVNVNGAAPSASEQVDMMEFFEVFMNLVLALERGAAAALAAAGKGKGTLKDEQRLKIMLRLLARYDSFSDPDPCVRWLLWWHDGSGDSFGAGVLDALRDAYGQVLGGLLGKDKAKDHKHKEKDGAKGDASGSVAMAMNSCTG